MFEYHLYGLQDPNRIDPAPFVFTGTTTDFLQVLADITKYYSPEMAGHFVTELFSERECDAETLRVTDWNFELMFSETDPRKITLRKVA